MCDNASNNDSMVDNLSFELTDFRGDTYRVWCFDHITNLVAQALIRLFDIKKVGAVDDDLSVLTEGNDTEELMTRVAELKVGKGIEEDDNDGFIDVLGDLWDGDLADFQQDVRPARMVIAKVSKICDGP